MSAIDDKVLAEAKAIFEKNGFDPIHKENCSPVDNPSALSKEYSDRLDKAIEVEKRWWEWYGGKIGECYCHKDIHFETMDGCGLGSNLPFDQRCFVLSNLSGIAHGWLPAALGTIERYVDGDLPEGMDDRSHSLISEFQRKVDDFVKSEVEILKSDIEAQHKKDVDQYISELCEYLSDDMMSEEKE